MKLSKALKETFGVELEDCDKVELEHNYCNYMIVDVIVTDGNTGKKNNFLAYNTKLGIFPY